MTYPKNRHSRIDLNKDMEGIINAYRNGVSANIIAKAYGVHCRRITNELLRSGIILRSQSKACQKYSINEDYFDFIDTERKAYFLGFLYADGGNFIQSKNGTIKGKMITINLKYEDKELLEKLSIEIYNEPYELGYREKKQWFCPKRRKNYNASAQAVFRIANEHISKQLYDKGMVANKSLVLKFPEIEEILLPHFIRGYFDGDGSIKDVTNKKCTFTVCGTKDFLEVCQGVLIKRSSLNKTKLEKCGNIFKLHYTGRINCIKFRDFIYSGSSIHLKRKFDMFQQIRIKKGVYSGC
jgi:hypothetical protein